MMTYYVGVKKKHVDNELQNKILKNFSTMTSNDNNVRNYYYYHHPDLKWGMAGKKYRYLEFFASIKKNENSSV